MLEGDEEIRALREKVRELPEDAAYYDRVRLGELIVRALEQTRYNKTKAAELLGMSFRQLRYRVKKLGIE